MFQPVGRRVQAWYLRRLEGHIKTLNVNDVVVQMLVDLNDVQRSAVEFPHPENIFLGGISMPPLRSPLGWPIRPARYHWWPSKVGLSYASVEAVASIFYSH